MTISPAFIDILLPTFNRLDTLIMTLSGVAAQTMRDVHVVVADQSQTSLEQAPVVASLRRVIEARGGSFEWHHRTELRGIAEQRQFLLERATAESVLYLDDDVFMEPWVVERLHAILCEQGCAFVGAYPIQPPHIGWPRASRWPVEFWNGPVQPEAVEPGSPEWRRRESNMSPELFHSGPSPSPDLVRLYKVAWVGACVLYDRAKLLAVGGFTFWPRLPRYHSAEEVLVQNLLMRRWGGCGIMPSGTYLAQVPRTVLSPQGKTDASALDLLPEMVDRCG